MKDRIKLVRTMNALKQADFGNKIGVKQNTITCYESGTRNPTDAVVHSICREFNINEEWLRYGTGDMEKIKDDKLYEYLGRIATKDDTFIVDMIEVYFELDQTSRDSLKEIANNMIEKTKNRG